MERGGREYALWSIGIAVVLIFICVFLIALLFVKGLGAKLEEGRPGA